MLRLGRRLAPRRLAAPLGCTLVWLVAFTAIGGLGLRWSLPLALPLAPSAPPSLLLPPLQQAASAAPAPRHVTRSLSELGLGGASAPRGLSDYALLFSRVPKAGSELLSLLLQRLQLANGFRLLQLPLPPQLHGRRLSATEQEELVVRVTDDLRREALPVAFHGNVFFTNFSTFDRQSPTFVSLLRNPVDRALAGVHHAAAAAAVATRAAGVEQDSVDSNRLNRRRSLAQDGDDDGALVTLERCLSPTATAGQPRRRRPECAWFEQETPYFCGQDHRCGPGSIDSEWALQRAKANMEQYFPVVGILEELNATLAVLESRLPLFFAGVRNVYRHQLHEPHVNWDKKKPSNFKPEIRRRVERRLAFEYELYIWAKQRLMQQHFEDSQKAPIPDEAGHDRIAHSVHKRAQS